MINLKYLSFSVFMLLSCFSYVSFSLNSMDSQIWHFFVMPFCFLFFRSKAAWFTVAPELVLSLVVFVFLFFSGFTFIELRSLGSYWSLLFTIVVTVFALACGLKDRFYILVCSVSLLYFFGGLAQIVFGKFIFEFLVHVRTTPERGVTSFAAEPSYYATITIILSWLILIYSDYRPSVFGKIALFCNLCSISLLAQSAIGIVYILLAVSIISVSKVSFSRILMFTSAIGGLFFVVGLTDGRVSALSSLILEGGLYDLFMSDASVNLRVAHAFLPIYISLDNLLFPFFYGNYSTVSLLYANEFQHIFWYKGFGGERIMSFVGAMIFELGLIALLYLLSFVIRAFWFCRKPSRKIMEMIFLFALLVSAVPIAMPLVGILFGSLIGQRSYTFAK
ncbi:hypothetical protein [Marinobacter alkaliphilus]|uniref:hypothetical protein n=1 Tax=Marinobacter alkaliphilus TaxID=254719 RepID=UPI003D80DA88|nr:hypothetical protein PBN92_13100 [Marinobacter alkaliphilus]